MNIIGALGLKIQALKNQPPDGCNMSDYKTQYCYFGEWNHELDLQDMHGQFCRRKIPSFACGIHRENGIWHWVKK